MPKVIQFEIGFLLCNRKPLLLFNGSDGRKTLTQMQTHI